MADVLDVKESLGTDVDRVDRGAPCGRAARCSSSTTASTSSTARPTWPAPLPRAARTCGCSPPQGRASASRDERLVAVGPLDPAGSGVELFNERAAAAPRPSIRRPAATTSRRSAAASTASRSRSSWPPLARGASAPADLLERLDDRLRLLTGGRRAGVERHRTLRATIEWSYDLLTPPQQTLFECLSIFAGPFDRVGRRDDRR